MITTKLSEHERLMVLTKLGETVKAIMGGIDAGMLTSDEAYTKIGLVWCSCDLCLNEGYDVEWFSNECRRVTRG